MTDALADLRNGVVLAELGGYGDGYYCARHGAGAALVLLGTYIVDEGDNVPYPASFVFKPNKRRYTSYLQEHIEAARASRAKVGISVISVELDHTLDFLRAAEECGADYVSLCAHSEMEMFTRHGLGDRLCRQENRDLLRKWTSAILDVVSIPFILKIGLLAPAETAGAISLVADLGVPVVHVNIRDSSPGSQGLKFLESVRGMCDCLIAGGGVRDLEGARRILAAGANAVAIATAAMHDANLCGNLQRMLRGTTPSVIRC